MGNYFSNRAMADHDKTDAAKEPTDEGSQPSEEKQQTKSDPTPALEAVVELTSDTGGTSVTPSEKILEPDSQDKEDNLTETQTVDESQTESTKGKQPASSPSERSSSNSFEETAQQSATEKVLDNTEDIRSPVEEVDGMKETQEFPYQKTVEAPNLQVSQQDETSTFSQTIEQSIDHSSVITEQTNEATTSEVYVAGSIDGTSLQPSKQDSVKVTEETQANEFPDVLEDSGETNELQAQKHGDETKIATAALETAEIKEEKEKISDNVEEKETEGLSTNQSRGETQTVSSVDSESKDSSAVHVEDQVAQEDSLANQDYDRLQDQVELLKDDDADSRKQAFERPSEEVQNALNETVQFVEDKKTPENVSEITSNDDNTGGKSGLSQAIQVSHPEHSAGQALDTDTVQAVLRAEDNLPGVSETANADTTEAMQEAPPVPDTDSLSPTKKEEESIDLLTDRGEAENSSILPAELEPEKVTEQKERTTGEEPEQAETLDIPSSKPHDEQDSQFDAAANEVPPLTQLEEISSDAAEATNSASGTEHATVVQESCSQNDDKSVEQSVRDKHEERGESLDDAVEAKSDHEDPVSDEQQKLVASSDTVSNEPASEVGQALQNDESNNATEKHQEHDLNVDTADVPQTELEEVVSDAQQTPVTSADAVSNREPAPIVEQVFQTDGDIKVTETHDEHDLNTDTAMEPQTGHDAQQVSVALAGTVSNEEPAPTSEQEPQSPEEISHDLGPTELKNDGEEQSAVQSPEVHPQQAAESASVEEQKPQIPEQFQPATDATESIDSVEEQPASQPSEASPQQVVEQEKQTTESLIQEQDEKACESSPGQVEEASTAVSPETPNVAEQILEEEPKHEEDQQSALQALEATEQKNDVHGDTNLTVSTEQTANEESSSDAAEAAQQHEVDQQAVPQVEEKIHDSPQKQTNESVATDSVPKEGSEQKLDLPNPENNEHDSRTSPEGS